MGFLRKLFGGGSRDKHRAQERIRALELEHARQRQVAENEARIHEENVRAEMQRMQAEYEHQRMLAENETRRRQNEENHQREMKRLAVELERIEADKVLQLAQLDVEKQEIEADLKKAMMEIEERKEKTQLVAEYLHLLMDKGLSGPAFAMMAYSVSQALRDKEVNPDVIKMIGEQNIQMEVIKLQIACSSPRLQVLNEQMLSITEEKGCADETCTSELV